MKPFWTRCWEREKPVEKIWCRVEVHRPKQAGLKQPRGARICRFRAAVRDMSAPCSAATQSMPILGALGQVAVRELDVIAPRRAHRWASTTPGAEIGPPDNWGRNLRLDAVAAPPASSSSSRAPSAAKGWVTRCRGDAPHQSRLALDDHRSSTGRAKTCPRRAVEPSPTAPSCDYLRVRRPATRPRRRRRLCSKPPTKPSRSAAASG